METTHNGTTKINVRIALKTEQLGTIPKDEQVFKAWIETKRPDGGSDDVEVESIEAQGWTGFHKDEKGIFIFEYMIKGFLKHWGNVLKDRLDVAALRSKIDDMVFISPRRIYPLNADGNIITEPDGVNERSIRVMTAQGPRVALIRSDYINAGATYDFSIEIVDVGMKKVKSGEEKGKKKPHSITPEMIRELLEHGRLLGLGQFRNGGYGRFEIVEFEVE